MNPVIKIIDKSEALYHQSLSNQENTWGVFWWDEDCQLQRAAGGFETYEEARSWWIEWRSDENH